MTASLKPDSKLDLHSVKARFLKINRERLELTRQSLGKRQVNFIELLPLLFHENNPELPGYIDGNGPTGISEYATEQPAIKAAKGYFKTYKPTRRARRVMDINGIYFMGSSGSIAYNSKSDFAEEFKQGKQQGLSSKSSGSAQHYLLLDEFYRSSLLMPARSRPSDWSP